MWFNKISRIDADRPDPALIEAAGRLIAKGGIVVYPTRSLYGLGAAATDSDAVAKIFSIKRRPRQKPLPILIRDRSELRRLVRNVPPVAVRLMDAFWPGGVTIVFEAGAQLPANLTAGTGKIGVRLPAHPVAAALAMAAPGPITGTSANISGEAGCSDVSRLPAAVRDCVDLILDAGPLQPGIGSTVVDITAEPLQILREGSVSAEKIFAAANRSGTAAPDGV